MDAEGNELVAQNADEPFVPASVNKIVTAWLAMEVLGGDYRFETRFYLDDKRVLYVRGGGDPFLISEELAPLATELVAAVGKEPIMVYWSGWASPRWWPTATPPPQRSSRRSTRPRAGRTCTGGSGSGTGGDSQVGGLPGT